MSSPASFDVAAIVEGRKLGRFGVGLVLISWLVTFFDGYDMNVISFASKRMEEAFHVGHVTFGYVFSIGIFGTLLGGVLFGYFGDRAGRRPAIITAAACFSALTLLLAFARNLPELMILRFLAGLALGGAMPLIWSLNIEFAPRRLRATIITLIMLGYGFGVAASGPVASYLLPRFDWPGVFIFGGLTSLIAVLILIACLPESLRLLAARGGRPERIAGTLRRMGVETPEDLAGVRFFVAEEVAAGKPSFRLSMLFEGRLRVLTPLIWAAYFASSISTYFMTSWGPVVLRGLGFGLSGTGWLSFGNSLCSMAGGLAIMRSTDRHGAISIAVLPITAIPLLLVAGLAPMTLTQFLFLSLVMSVFLGGGHYGITSVISAFYPSHIRASGSGWANAAAKVGSVLGPLVGGYVLSSGLPVKMSYAFLAACPALYGFAIIAIGLIERRGGGWPQRQTAPQPGSVPAAE